MVTRMYRCVCVVVMGSMSLALTGCETKAQSGALVGSLGGAAVGAIIGHQSGHAGAGALIGAAVGTGGGYIAGNEMDKADAREEVRYQRATRVDREARYQTSAGASRTVTKRQVIQWTGDGVKDEIIIDRIEQSGTVFSITVTDENELRDVGVSEEVIRAMKYSHARR
jgi:uncharacterized protein YcfJ